ncbi:phage tail protein E [gamma proteobacterium HTCC5015]|nr:phage tail protein E [gamma proteobacterium HTCC5015]
MAKEKPHTITLDVPVKREGGDVTELDIRKPQSGELRGLNLMDIMQLDVNAIIKLAPRVTNPALTENEVRQMEPADLTQLGTELAGFLVPKSAKEG